VRILCEYLWAFRRFEKGRVSRRERVGKIHFSGCCHGRVIARRASRAWGFSRWWAWSERAELSWVNTVVCVCLRETQAPPARSGPPANLTLETVDTSAVAAESAPVVASLTTLYQVRAIPTPHSDAIRELWTSSEQTNDNPRLSNDEAGPLRRFR